MRKRLWIAPAVLAVVGLGLAVTIAGDVPRERVEQRYVDVSSRFEAADGLRMHFREWGDPDAPALLPHGQSDSASARQPRWR